MTNQNAEPEAGAPATPTESGEPGASGQEPVAPANPTEAQQEQAGTQATSADEAKRLSKEDDNWRVENPDRARVREANPSVGGESFDYLNVVSG